MTVLARGKRYEEVRDEGIVIEDPFKNKRRVAKVPVINRLDPDDLYDFVLVVVRKNQVADLLTVLAHNRSPNVVFMGNNLSGPGDFTSVLGKHRVMIGAVYAAGKRDGSIIRAITVKWFGVPLGEVDGKITPRLKRLVGIFRQAGIKARTSTEIVDFQKTHAAVVALLAKLIIKHGCDTSALARSTEDLRLFLHARRRRTRSCVPSVTGSSRGLRSSLDSFRIACKSQPFEHCLTQNWGRSVRAGTVPSAPDEMRQLGLELQALVDQTGLPAPAVRKVLGDC